MNRLALVMVLALAGGSQPARGDALWQWYAEGTNCNAVGAEAQLQIAREHKLNAVVNGSRADRDQYFAAHPALDREAAKRMELLSHYCRDTD
jgi:hypothetical protein